MPKLRKKTARKRTIYRDRKTGRIVSKATWRRSRARGGKRYVAQRIGLPKRKAAKRKPHTRPRAPQGAAPPPVPAPGAPPPRVPPPEPEAELEEFDLDFDSEGDSDEDWYP